MEKFQNYIAKFANALNQNRIIQTISKGLMMMMPVLMVGAFASLFQQLPIPGYTQLLQSSGIYGILQTIVNVTTNLLALYATFCIAYRYTSDEKKDGIAAGLIALMSFILVTPMFTQGKGYAAVTNLPLSWLGAKGMFTGMIIAIVSAKIYCLLIEKNITINLPDSVPPFVSKSFTGIIPGIVLAVIWGLLSLMMKMTSFGDLHTLIYTIIGAPLTHIGGSIWAALLIYVLSGLCWFCGIHGIAVVSAVMPIWMAADAANVAAISAGGAASNIVTYNWINAVSNVGGAGATIGLIILCVFKSKSARYKEMGKLAIVPSLFGINEPVVFGMPVVLNATLMIPFVFLQPILILVSYLLTIAHILPVGNGVGIATTIPVVSGFLNGGVRMAIWNVVCVIISILVYYPFFKVLDNEALAEENHD